MVLNNPLMKATGAGRWKERAGGQTLVETALVLPVALAVLGALLAAGLWSLANLVGYAASSYSAWQGSAIYRDNLPDPQSVSGMADTAPSDESREVSWDGQWSTDPSQMERKTVEAANRWLDLLGNLAAGRRITVRTQRSVVVPGGDPKQAYTKFTMESIVEFNLPLLVLAGQPLAVRQGTLTRVKEVGPYGSF
mgnify:FL=1